jgi:tetratricopeptide (TPR) repeat protein
LVNGRPILKVFALGLLLGGIMTAISSFYLFMIEANFAYGTLSGIVLLLIGFVLAGLELTSVLPLFRIEQGSGIQARNWIIFSMLMRLLILYTGFQAGESANQQFIGILMILNAIALALEGVLLVLLFVLKKEFLPTEEEIKATMRRMGKATVKTVSECPNCHEIVEKEWVLCPQCGTALPRLCANCGKPLSEREDKCMNCGAIIEKQESIKRSIQNLVALSEEEAKPEAKSVRYARLAEAYLKNGETDLALETYRKAIHFSEFDSKRCNFLVKMANILHNAGRDEEATKVLDASLQLDPHDIAGATIVKGQINADATVKKAREALKAGDEARAVSLADEAIQIDPSDYHGASIVKSTILTNQAERLAKSGNKEGVTKLLNEAVRLDPRGLGPAIAVRDRLAPREKRKEEKVKKNDLKAKMKAAKQK